MNPNINIPTTAADAYREMLAEQTVKSQIIKDGYIYFPDGNIIYKISPYKAVGKADKLVTLGVQKWYSVNVATGEDLDDAGLAEVDVDNKGNYFVVNSNDNKITMPALISSEPNKIYL